MGKSSNKVKEPKSQKEASKVAIEEWNRYVDTFVPHTNAYLRDSTGFNVKTGKFEPIREEIQTDKVQGQINAEIAQNRQAVSPAGFDPSRSQYVVGNPDATKSAAKAMAKGTQSAKDRQIQAMMSAVTLGRGEANDATTGMGDIAANAVEDSILDNRRKQALSGTYASSIGSAVGAAVGSYSPQPRAVGGSPMAGTGNLDLDSKLGLGASSNTYRVLNPSWTP